MYGSLEARDQANPVLHCHVCRVWHLIGLLGIHPACDLQGVHEESGETPSSNVFSCIGGTFPETHLNTNQKPVPCLETLHCQVVTLALLFPIMRAMGDTGVPERFISMVLGGAKGVGSKIGMSFLGGSPRKTCSSVT